MNRLLRQPLRMPKPKTGELRVYNIVNPPSEPINYPVNDPGHAKRLIKALADSQLLYPDSVITSNLFGLEVYDGSEWLEWESEDGETLDEWEPEEVHG